MAGPWALGGSSPGFGVLGKFIPLLLNGTAALALFLALAQPLCLQRLQSHFMADLGGPSAVGEKYQASPKGSETCLFGQHLPFRVMGLPFPLV